jgi:photosystem II stability/assembly factor-like uncharacterized protein
LILIGCRPVSTWHWERAEAGLPRQAIVLSVAVDPANPDLLWAGYYAPGGLAASRDAGLTWTVVAQGLRDNPVFDLLVLPGSQLWAATRDGLLGSADGGATWRAASGDLPQAAAFALAADAAKRLYVGFDGAGLYAGQPGEGGWTPLTHAESLTQAAILSLTVSPDGTHLYAGSAGQGLFASSDAGRTWTTAFPGDYVPNLALHPAEPETAVASLRDRLVRTRDGGGAWEILPVPWARDEVVALLWLANSLAGADGELWAGSGQGQVYLSRDKGDSWLKAGASLPAEGGVLSLALANSRLPGGPPRLLAGAWTGVYAMEDGGQDWTYLTPTLGAPQASALLAANGSLLLGTRTGLFSWQPAAHRWAGLPTVQDADYPTSDGPLPEGVTALAVAPSHEQVIYAGTASGRLYRSPDGGASWARVTSDLEVGTRALAVAPDDADHLYLLAAWERMYESLDGGQSWQARWTGLKVTSEAISLAIDPAYPSHIYLGTDTGLYRSHYQGADWRPVGRPLDDQTVLTLATRAAPSAGGAPSILFIGATRGAYRSFDAGASVEPWGRGLEGVSVTAFLFDPQQAQVVYAGTAYGGLYRSLDGGETWQPIGPAELGGEIVEAMAWGPNGELFVATPEGVWIGTD